MSDLRKTCADYGIRLRFAVSPVADRLLKHHRGFGGVSYVYVNNEGSFPGFSPSCATRPGVDDALTVARGRLPFPPHAERIGDLVVMADKDTVFGDLAGLK